MTLVACVEGENQVLRRDSRNATPVPSASPKRNDTILDARGMVMGFLVSWKISLFSVYAWGWVIEYTRCCLTCCSFAAQDSQILFPTHAGITNIVPTAEPMRAEGFRR